MLGLSVGVVLADSSVVTIALPEILAQYDVEIATLAWALTSYNLALALAALPAAFLGASPPDSRLRRRHRPLRGCIARLRLRLVVRAARRRPRRQGAAGAAVVCGALALLADVAGGDAPAARIWAFAGVIGAALGPAAGGVLTQLFGWESIFLVQAPVVLCALLTLRGARAVPDSGRSSGRTSPRTPRCCSSRARSWPRSSCS